MIRTRHNANEINTNIPVSFKKKKKLNELCSSLKTKQKKWSEHRNKTSNDQNVY